MSQRSQNPLLLAADASPALLPLLRSNPSLASVQDASGYSLVHALTSYNHLDLLKTVVQEFGLSPNLRDEDNETALFVAETVEASRMLIEDLGGDLNLRNNDGQIAEDKIREEGEFEAVADFLRATRMRNASKHDSRQASQSGDLNPSPAPLPISIKIDMRTMSEADIPTDVDETMRRRIEELAQRNDFTSDDGQQHFRQLVKDAVREVSIEESNLRRRLH